MQRTGNMDLVYDMQPGHKDPDYEAFVSQVKVYRQFFGKLAGASPLRSLQSLAGTQRTTPASKAWQVPVVL